ncbi:MAG: ribonuclease T2 [Pseudomonadota bacterium]
MRFLVLCLGMVASMAQAEGEPAGEFDYYVLALSWSPNWCALEGDARGADQCDSRHDYGWILHGLWPQFERGWPSYCRTNSRDPSRRQTRDMSDIMASAGLAWHQWKKHGRCSGLSSEAYFQLSRDAYGQIARPELFRKLDRQVILPASVVEEAFLQANPNLQADHVTVTCKSRHIQEVRICLSTALEPRRCGSDVLRDCDLDRAVFDPIR